METRAKLCWWSEKKIEIETKVKDCTACLASGKKYKVSITKKTLRKTKKKLTELGQENQNDFTAKLHNNSNHGEGQILIAVDRFSMSRTVKICKTSEKNMTQNLPSNFNLYGIPKTNQIR